MNAPTQSHSPAVQVEESLTVSVETAARMLGLSRSGAFDAIRRGDIPHVRIGRRILVPRAKLLEMLNAA